MAIKISQCEITPKDFIHLLDHDLQTIKEYYRDKFKPIKRGNVPSIFQYLRVGSDFLNWFQSLQPNEYRRILSDTQQAIPIRDEIIILCDRINQQDEILKYVVYSLIKKKTMPQQIAQIAGISRKTIQKYVKTLSELINPRTQKKYLIYSTKYSNQGKSFIGYTIKRLPLDDIIVLPIKQRNDLVQQINKLIEQLKHTYKDEYIIRDLLNCNFSTIQNKRINLINSANGQLNYRNLNNDKILVKIKKELNEKNDILRQIKALSNNYKKANYNSTLELCKIVLDIKDNILGGNAQEIANIHNRKRNFVYSLAKVLIPDKESYSYRFYDKNSLKNYVISIAEQIISHEIAEEHLSNITHSLIQQLMDVYRMENNIKEQRTVFKYVRIDITFARWI
ncbi:hypothetical protein ES703_110471 [subsurface metagenome]